MTSIRVPKQLIEDIDKLRHRFLWVGDSKISGGKCKVAWTDVTKPVEFGGLGVIELQRFSRALRLRWLWFQWTNPEWPWNGTEVSVDLIDLALFNAVTAISIGDGRKTSFWHINWLNGETLRSSYPLLYKHSTRKKRSVREAVDNGKWISDIAHNLNDSLLDDFFSLWSKIEALNLNLHDAEEDSITWSLESSGQFSTRSAYNVQFAGHTLSSFPVLIWDVWVPLKCKFFLWLLLQDKLWTAARLQRWGWENNYFCALCIRNLETAQHLFFECPCARAVWNLVADWCSCAQMNPAGWEDKEDIEDWFAQTTDWITQCPY
jgi:hypothetical protein